MRMAEARRAAEEAAQETHVIADEAETIVGRHQAPRAALLLMRI